MIRVSSRGFANLTRQRIGYESNIHLGVMNLASMHQFMNENLPPCAPRIVSGIGERCGAHVNRNLPVVSRKSEGPIITANCIGKYNPIARRQSAEEDLVICPIILFLCEFSGLASQTCDSIGHEREQRIAWARHPQNAFY